MLIIVGCLIGPFAVEVGWEKGKPVFEAEVTGPGIGFLFLCSKSDPF